MFERPRFKSCWRLESIEPDLSFLFSETESIALQGELLCALAAAIDGMRTLPELADTLAGSLSILDVQYGLELLDRDGYLEESAGELSNLSRDHDSQSIRTKNSQVTCYGIALVTTGSPPWEAMLGHVPGVRLVVADDYLNSNLAEFNRRRLADQQNWLLAKPIGREFWLGPLFHPQRTACWGCLAARLRQHRPLHEFVRLRSGRYPSIPALPSSEDAWLAAARKIEGLEQGIEALSGRVWTLDTATRKTKIHELFQLPNCPECGSRQEHQGDANPFVDAGQNSRPRAEAGVWRRLSYRQLLSRLEHHVSPITGIVSFVRPLGNTQPDWLHVWSTSNPVARVTEDWSSTRTAMRSRCLGTGTTTLEAKAAALGEAVERYSGIFQGSELVIRAPMTELQNAIHPNDCMLFSRDQYRERDRWNQQEAHSNWVPRPFDATAEVDWTPIWSLANSCVKYLPTQYLFYNYPRAESQPFYRPDSSGCASGNTLVEAALHGLLELVERDCVAIWWYNRVPRPSVDLADFSMPSIRQVVADYQALNREIQVLDISHDFRIPAFVAISSASGGNRDSILLGFGAHFDPGLAVQRALGELGQSMAGEMARSKTLSNPAFASRYLTSDFPWVDNDQRQRRRSDYLNPPIASQDQLLEKTVKLAQSLGVEVLILNQSRPETHLCTVRMVAPGLRSMWARFATGRLFDIPVRLAWRHRPLTENELNPAHLFL